MPSRCCHEPSAKAGPLADEYALLDWRGAVSKPGFHQRGGDVCLAGATIIPNHPCGCGRWWRRRRLMRGSPTGRGMTRCSKTRTASSSGRRNWIPANELVVDGRLSLENSKFQQRDFPGAAAVYERLTNQWQTLNQVQQCEGAYLFYRAKMELGDFAAALAAATNLVQIAGSPTNQDWLATGWACTRRGAGTNGPPAGSDPGMAEQSDQRAGDAGTGGDFENRGTGDCARAIDQCRGDAHQFSGAVSRMPFRRTSRC